MTPKIEALSAQLKLALNAGLAKLTEDLNELTIECRAEDFIEVCIKLRDHGVCLRLMMISQYCRL